MISKISICLDEMKVLYSMLIVSYWLTASGALTITRSNATSTTDQDTNLHKNMTQKNVYILLDPCLTQYES